jgi:hypothetical protein
MTACQISRLDSFRLIPAIYHSFHFKRVDFTIPGSHFSVLGSISPTFLLANRSSFCADQILMLLIEIALDKNAPKYGGQGKRCCLKDAVIFGRNVGETEQHLLYYLQCTGTFAHCANWLVKLIPAVVFLVVCDPSINKL